MELTINVFSTDFSTESPLVVTAGGISINGDANIAGSSSHTVTVTDFGTATLLVNEAGYLPYSMEIDNVFGEDLSVDIILIPEITDINNPNYLRPRPSFFTILDPCSYCVRYYYASSNFGDVSWFVNNMEYASGEKGIVSFASPGEYQLKVRNRTSGHHVDASTGLPSCGCGGVVGEGAPEVVTYDWDQQYANIFTGNTTSGSIDPIEDYLALDTQTNLVIEEYRVDISTEISTTREPLVGDNSIYYIRDEEITITPTISINRGIPDDYTVYYTVVDPRGVPILELAQPFGAPIVPIQFVLQELGVYNVTIRVVDNVCNLQYFKELQVETTNFINLSYVDCNTYKADNLSSDRSVSYTVSDVANAEFSQSGILGAGESVNLTLDNTSLYTFTAVYTEAEEEITKTYIINNYCNIEECMASYIESIFCEKDDDCNPCPDPVILNQMVLFYNTYFMKVHKFFQVNTYFTALETSDLDELLSLKSIMDKISSYCDRLHCTKGVDGAFNAYQAEGPYDWAGRGNNQVRNCACPPKYYNNGTCQKCGK